MDVIWKDSADKVSYTQARLNRVFNSWHPQLFPRAIVKATNTDDVVASVRMAVRDQHCQVAVRSGGHSIFGWSLHNQSILIDLGEWKEIVVDAASNIARVTTSVTGKELNDYLKTHHGMMFPAGHCPDAGLGGFMLQGGQGWNCRNWGWACEQLVAVEVVTAQGDLLLCNNKQNQDLYWAAQGAGPFFPGIVTRFHLQLLPYPTDGFKSSGYIYPANMYRTAFEWVQSIIPGADQDTEIVMVVFYSEPHREVCFKIYFVTMKQDYEDARTWLEKLHQTRPPGALAEWTCQDETLDSLYKDQATFNPASHYYYCDNVFLDNKTNVTEVLEEGLLALPPGKSFAFWYPMYPRSERTVPDMPLTVPSNHYFSMYSIAEDVEESERGRSWIQTTIDSIWPHAVGSYLGECDAKQPDEWYWSKHKAQSLRDVRQKWDPNSVFCTVNNTAQNN